MDRISEFENIMHSIMNDKSIESLIDLGFLKAPASTKYHYSFEGGLYEHSFNVMRALQNLTDRLNLEWQRKESPVIIGMLHDLCMSDGTLWEVVTANCFRQFPLPDRAV